MRKVPTISRLLKIIGLFLQNIVSCLQGSFAKETYIFREPTNRGHLTPCGTLLQKEHPQDALSLEDIFRKRAL